MERTLAIIKPDAVKNLATGEIIRNIELNKFNIVHMEKMELSTERAEAFYAVHKERSFFRELVDYMESGPIVVLALEKENAVKEWRDLMGATDPLKANPGSLRKMFGDSIAENATHGSDSLENAKIELNFFFPNL